MDNSGCGEPFPSMTSLLTDRMEHREETGKLHKDEMLIVKDQNISEALPVKYDCVQHTITKE